MISIIANYATDMRVLLSAINEYNISHLELNVGDDKENVENNKRRKKQSMLLCLYHSLHPDKYEELFTKNSEYLMIKKASEVAMEKYKKEKEAEYENRLKEKAINKLIPLTPEQRLAIHGAMMENYRGGHYSIPRGLENQCLNNGAVASLRGDAILCCKVANSLGGLYFTAPVKTIESALGINLYDWIEKPFRESQSAIEEELKHISDEIRVLDDPLSFAAEHPNKVFNDCHPTGLMKAMVIQGYFDDAAIDTFLSDNVSGSKGTPAYVRRTVIEKTGDLTLEPIMNIDAVINDVDKILFSKPEIINADIIEFFLKRSRPDDTFIEKKNRIMELLKSTDKITVDKKKRLIFARLENHGRLIEKLLEESKTALEPFLEKELSREEKQNAQKIIIFSAKDHKFSQDRLSEIIGRVWSQPISADDAKVLSNIKDEFEKSGFKYSEVDFAINDPEIMRFITGTNCWSISDKNLMAILDCDEDDDLSNELEMKCNDEEWCSKNGVDGGKVKTYVRESGFLPINKPHRGRSIIDFSSLGMDPGVKITLVSAPDAVITVADKNHVMYKNEKYALSTLRRKLSRGSEKRTLEVYFYKGHTLAELQKMREMSKSLEEFIEVLKKSKKLSRFNLGNEDRAHFK